MKDPLRHHGDVEATEGLLDFAVNVYAGPRPDWLDRALADSLAYVDRYPSPERAESALARRHGVSALATAGAAEAFTLLARLRPWRRPVVVHPQFTEPHAALVTAGHEVESVILPPPFTFDPGSVPEDADLVIVGNPTNPTGVLHPAEALRALVRPGRLVVVDEAFMDTVPDESESLAAYADEGLVVLRSLTKHWSIPGIRAGYVLGGETVLEELRTLQTPWSVSTPALAAIVACSSVDAKAESVRRAIQIAEWREHLVAALDERGIVTIPSVTSFVLASVEPGTHDRLRHRGIAVRTATTFPGLDDSWVRIAVRPPGRSEVLLQALNGARKRTLIGGLESPSQTRGSRWDSGTVALP